MKFPHVDTAGAFLSGMLLISATYTYLINANKPTAWLNIVILVLFAGYSVIWLVSNSTKKEGK